MTPQERIQAMKNLGFTVTPEMEEREYRISLDTIERTYGADWEQTADAVRTHIEAMDVLDWVSGAEQDMADYLDEKRTQEESRY